MLRDWRARPLKVPVDSQAIGWFPGRTWKVVCPDCELHRNFTTEEAVK